MELLIQRSIISKINLYFRENNSSEEAKKHIAVFFLAEKNIHSNKEISHKLNTETDSWSSNRTGGTLLWESSCNNKRSYSAYAGHILQWVSRKWV